MGSLGTALQPLGTALSRGGPVGLPNPKRPTDKIDFVLLTVSGGLGPAVHRWEITRVSVWWPRPVTHILSYDPMTHGTTGHLQSVTLSAFLHDVVHSQHRGERGPRNAVPDFTGTQQRQAKRFTETKGACSLVRDDITFQTLRCANGRTRGGSV